MCPLCLSCWHVGSLPCMQHVRWSSARSQGTAYGGTVGGRVGVLASSAGNVEGHWFSMGTLCWHCVLPVGALHGPLCPAPGVAVLVVSWVSAGCASGWWPAQHRPRCAEHSPHRVCMSCLLRLCLVHLPRRISRSPFLQSFEGPAALPRGWVLVGVCTARAAAAAVCRGCLRARIQSLCVSLCVFGGDGPCGAGLGCGVGPRTGYAPCVC